jgi:hypothetical protein
LKSLKTLQYVDFQDTTIVAFVQLVALIFGIGRCSVFSGSATTFGKPDQWSRIAQRIAQRIAKHAWQRVAQLIAKPDTPLVCARKQFPKQILSRTL